MKTRSLCALLAGLVATGNVAAQHYDGRYRAGDQAGYDYARVLRVDPIIVRDYPEHEERRCYDRDDHDGYAAHGGYYRDYGHGESSAARGLATVVGGVAGAVLGSRVGGGNGRLVGTAVGTMVGGVAGRSIYDANNHGYGPRGARECEQVSYQQERDRVDGYDVAYEYAGRIYHAHSDYNPGDRIRVRVNVLPD